MASTAYDTYLSQTKALLDRLDSKQVMAFTDCLEGVFKNGKSVYVCGNGGSAANASHFAEDLAMLMLDKKSNRRLRVMTLTDSAPLTMAISNDDGYERVFEQQLRVYAEPGDALVSISGSGNSPNVLRATQWAKEHGMKTLGLTGYDGGKLRGLVDHDVHVPSNNMGMLECVHLIVIDYVCKELRFRAYGVPHAER